ncbi:MAG TPA: glycosyl hydrolase family 28-related protein, partial [Streptosporangiaceae bacterium]
SAGAIDWKVLFAGVATDLQDALGSIYGLFFNVKSPEFGAIGNGSADDTASWQAAHDAAFAAGGGVVVVPPGTYNISSAIAWKAGVHLFCMPDSVTLRQVTAAAVHIAIGVGLASPTKTPTCLIGCAFDSTVTNTATQVTVAHGAEETIILQGCRFNISDFCTGAGVVIASSLGTTIVRDSVLTARANVRLIYDTSTANDGVRLFVEGCWLKSFLGGAGSELVKTNNNELRVTDSRFLFQSSTGSAIGVTTANANYSCIVSGCNFKDSAGGATPYAVQLFLNGRIYVDDSNYFGPGVFPYLQNATTDILSEGLSYAAQRKEGNGTTTGVAHTVNDFVESFFLRSTNVAAPAITLPKILFYGQMLRLAIWNNSGSDWAATSPSLTTAAGIGVMYNPADTPNAPNGFACTVVLVAMNRAGAPKWVTMGRWGMAG